MCYRRPSPLLSFACWFILILFSHTILIAEAERKPNIIFILTDDLGYGDLGVLFQNDLATTKKLFTPELDKMANEGIQLRNHYCPAPVCAPSRASLLTGVHQGNANIRNNDFDKALDNNHNLATILKEAGYRTAIIGKYGLQGSGNSASNWPAYPTKRGFDYFFGYVRHADGHNQYPFHNFGYRNRKEVWEQNSEISSQLELCYTTDLFTARAKKYIIDETTNNPETPFFLYLSYSTPHAALQVPTQAYPQYSTTPGREALDGGLQWRSSPSDPIINTASGSLDSFIHPDYDNRGWGYFEERFATSVRRIDDAVGDLLLTLENLGIDENTLVVFTSDNGPHEESYEGTPSGQADYVASMFDSYGNFEGIKRDTWEGGIRMPTFAWWPNTINVQDPETGPSSLISELPSQFQDWLPTFAELAGVPAPARADGVSLVPTLTGVGLQRTPLVYIEYLNGGSTPYYSDFLSDRRGQRRGQMQVIQLDGYKGIRYDIGSHSDDFEIYDVNGLLGNPDDRESNNLAGSSLYFTTLQQRMKDRVLQIRMPNSSATRPYDNINVPGVDVGPISPGLAVKVFEGDFSYLPDYESVPPFGQTITSGIDLSVLTNGDNPGAQFEGFLFVPSSGEYRFSLQATGRAFVRIHDVPVIDADFAYTSGSTREQTMLLEAGYHPITISYIDLIGTNPSLSIEWGLDGQLLNPIDNSLFFDQAAAPGPPIANDDSISTDRNTPILIDVLSNDFDDGTPEALAITYISGVQGGSAVLQGNKILFTPSNGFLGEASFVYTISDGETTVNATVRVSVFPPADDLWLNFEENDGNSVYDVSGRFIGTIVQETSAFGDYLESGGELVMEAEGATVDARADGRLWSQGTSSGVVYMGTADIDSAGTIDWASGSELHFDFVIQTAGNYSIATRRSSGDGDSDSVWLGLNGSQIGGAQFTGVTSGYEWSDGVALGFLSAGEHSLQIRRREDGHRIDRVMLASGSVSLPTGSSVGPAESDRLTGGESRVPGLYGQAVAFYGAGQIEVAASNFTPPLGSSDRTVSAWIKATAPGAIIAWGSANSPSGGKWNVRIEDVGVDRGALRLEVESGYKLGDLSAGAVNLLDDNWHHIAVTFANDGSPNVADAVLYVDGIVQPALISTQSINTDLLAPLSIGSDDQDRFMVGLIDSLRIDDRARSGSEIVELVNAHNQFAESWHRRFLGDDPIDWSADNDADGLSRIQELAFNGNPWLSNSTPPMRTGVFSANTFSLRYDQRTDMGDDLIYRLYQSNFLTHGWQLVPASDANIESNDISYLQTLHFEFDMSGSEDDRKFFRIETELSPE